MIGSLFEPLKPTAGDPLLALIAAHAADPRPEKIDAGVGVFRDSHGRTPVLGAIKEAERRLVREQASKSYLGVEGDRLFVQLLASLVFGAGCGDLNRMTGLQTPGGTGALRLGAELVALAVPGARVWMSTPTWANHGPIFAAAGLRPVMHPYFHPVSRRVDFEAMLDGLRGAERGDILLIHGCCHNPTGADLGIDEWSHIADLCCERGVVPFIDFAYQGLGAGIEEDAAGLRLLLGRVSDAIIAYSCDKNFGLYRDRVGALWVQADSATSAKLAGDHLGALARTCWSMPPDHGAAAVRIILEDQALADLWRRELDEMRFRLHDIRKSIAARDPAFAMLANQRGLFALLPLAPQAVAALRADHAIYTAPDGRINLSGLDATTIGRFADAVLPYMAAASDPATGGG